MPTVEEMYKHLGAMVKAGLGDMDVLMPSFDSPPPTQGFCECDDDDDDEPSYSGGGGLERHVDCNGDD